MRDGVMHPGKQEKQVITVVSRRREIRRCTPESRKKQVITVVQGNAPSHTFVGRTLPAIKLLTSVNKAGSCCHREIRRCTPEKGKTSHYRGARKRPPHIRSSAGRRKSKLLPRLYSLISLYFCGNCGCNFSMRDLRHRRCVEGVFCPHAPLRVSSKCERSRMGKSQPQLSFKT